MNANVIFRSWFYFRQGWSIYFAFIFAALNTTVTTYYLAISKSPFLQEIFPTFTLYIITLASVAVPVLVSIGYLHVKRSKAYKAEIDIQYEVNPYVKKMLENTNDILEQQYIFSNILIKLTNNEKLTEKESDYVNEINNKLEEHVKNRSKIN
jgi:hypothetical protein